jgi:hypothetical protein
MMDRWFDELGCLRVFFCAFEMKQLPERIGNLKHLRYLGISRNCHFNEVPSSLWSLYNLQILYARECTFEGLDISASKLINMQKFESRILEIKVDAAKLVEKIGFINNFPGKKDLVIYNLGVISKDHAAMVELRKRKDLNSLTLSWFSFRSPEHNEIEVLQALQPPINVESVHIKGYPGECFPTWFPGSDGLNAMPISGTILSSVTKLSIERCLNLSDCTLEQFVQPSYVPAIRKIEIADCTSVKSVRIEHFEDSTFLEELKVYYCPNITHLLAPSIRKLELKNSGSLVDSIDCSSLTILHLSCDHLASIDLQKWSLPALQELKISNCPCLISIRDSEQVPTTELSLGWARRRSSSTAKFPFLTHLTVKRCYKLETLDDLLTHEYLPAIKDLTILFCGRLNWQSGMMLPSSIQKLELLDSGSISRSCLGSLTSRSLQQLSG